MRSSKANSGLCERSDGEKQTTGQSGWKWDSKTVDACACWRRSTVNALRGGGAVQENGWQLMVRIKLDQQKNGQQERGGSRVIEKIQQQT